MIIDDDPSPIPRLGEQTHTYINNHKFLRALVRVYPLQQVGILLLFLAVNVGLLSNITSSAYDTEELALSEESQRYAVCLFRKGLHAEDLSVNLAVDEECVAESTRTQTVLAHVEHLKDVLAGHPMEAMAELLATEDPQVAALIVGIGKIESNWGRRSPWKAGIDCYNYWGYKTNGTRGQALGHACFGSAEEAVATIAKRLNQLIYDQGRTTPEQLLVWKCGRSCASHDPAGVARWVSVVDTYSQKAAMAQAQNIRKDLVSRR